MKGTSWNTVKNAGNTTRTKKAVAVMPKFVAQLMDASAPSFARAGSLSNSGNRSENSAGRGQILLILQGNSCSIAQKSSEIWTVQANLQQIYPKSDSLLAGY